MFRLPTLTVGLKPKKSLKICCAYYTNWPHLREEHVQLATMCRSFAGTELKPIAGKIDKDCAVPKDKLQKLAELGLMGVDISSEHGGAGMDSLSYVIAIEEIGRGCASSAILMCSAKFFCAPILMYGTLAQKEQYIRSCVSGSIVGCGMMSEPHCGSDAAAMTTTATDGGDHWILNGEKAWINGAHEATHGIVFASTDLALKAKGITAFIVEMKTPGITLGPKKDKLGQRGLSMSTVVFNNCRVDKKQLLGEKGKGFYIAMNMLDSGRIGIGAQSVGIAQASLDCATEYSKVRSSFGKPISSLYAIQSKLADMSCRIDSARLMLHNAALLKSGGQPYGRQSAQAKLVASETATFCAHEAIQILGGMGYVSDMPAERHYRDARASELIEGTSEVLRMVIAGHLLKE